MALTFSQKLASTVLPEAIDLHLDRLTQRKETLACWVDEAASPGSYLLLLRLNQTTELTVGRLGRCILGAGWYVYVGSALGGLGSRLRRHLQREKVRHWHVDALREVADLVRISYRVGPERLECAVAATLVQRTGASRPVLRFGASDCRCPGHLIRFSDEPDLRVGPDWLVKSIIDE
jgi:Uri superfamily endonuclease